MKSSKAFILLGLLFAVLLVVTSVVAYETPQNEVKVDEAKESDEWAGNEAMKAMVANLCERPSQTWSGKCSHTQNCDKQCQAWEGAKHGACHKRGNWKCFCYFNC